MKKYKQVLRDFDHVFADLKPSEPMPTVGPQPWLAMTDEEIDAKYYYFGRADLTRMKREAATERARKRVREIMAQELEDEQTLDPR
jgi:hypothetical protein